MKVTHPLNPIYDSNSRVLILGTIPSIKSREKNFYYAHPKNRFWKTLSNVYHEPIGNTKEERIEFLLKHQIALFDVLKSCDITSSKDNSIKNPIPNDFTFMLSHSKIKYIFTTGKKAYSLYQKYCYPKTKIEAICLPSPSPANCPQGIEDKLFQEYKRIREVIKEKNE